MTYSGNTILQLAREGHVRQIEWNNCRSARAPAAYGPPPSAGVSIVNSLITAPTPSFRHFLCPSVLACTRDQATTSGTRRSTASMRASLCGSAHVRNAPYEAAPAYRYDKRVTASNIWQADYLGHAYCRLLDGRRKGFAADRCKFNFPHKEFRDQNSARPQPRAVSAPEQVSQPLPAQGRAGHLAQLLTKAGRQSSLGLTQVSQHAFHQHAGGVL